MDREVQRFKQKSEQCSGLGLSPSSYCTHVWLLDVGHSDGAAAIVQEKNFDYFQTAESPRLFPRLRDDRQMTTLLQMVWVADAEGRVTFLSRSWYEYTESPDYTSPNQAFYQCLHPDERDEFRKSWQQAVSDREPFQREQRLQRNEGTYRWFLLKATPVASEEGQIQQWVGTCVATDQSQFRLLFEKSTDGILLLEEDLLIDCNQAAVEMMRAIDKGQLLGKHLAQLSPPTQPDGRSSQEKVNAMMAAALQQGSHRFEWVHQRQDGERFLVEVLLTAIAVQGRQILHVIWRDITQRKQAEEALFRQEQEFRALLENTPDAIMRLDRDLRYVYVNPAVERTAGISTQQFIGKTIWEMGSPSALCQRWEEALRRVLATGQAQAIEFEAPSVAGVRCYQSRVVPEFGPEGMVRYLLVVSRDITDLKQAEAEIRSLNLELEQRVQQRTAELEAANQLRQELLVREQAARTRAEELLHLRDESLNALRLSEERYRSLIIATSQIVWTTNAEGRMTGNNGAWREFTGQTEADIHGWGWLDAVHPDDRAPTLDQWSAAIAQRQLYHDEHRLQRRDGAYRLMQVRAVPIREADGSLREWVGIHTDITDLKQAEADLQFRADQLARTTNILATTATILDKRNQELDQFAYVVSHDLKAPLRAIANLSQWLEEDLEDCLTDETRRQMELLRGRVHRMENLIDGLLQYSRVGRVNVPQETVAVEALLQEIIDSLSPPANFTITITPNMPTLRTERLLLEQVLCNLISNAIKHHGSPAGQITIAVEEEVDRYTFSVTDDGPGIAPQYHSKIFGIFQTLEARDKVESTGIGLSLVKKIVESQGGSIHVESQLGQGATFRFTWKKAAAQDSGFN